MPLRFSLASLIVISTVLCLFFAAVSSGSPSCFAVFFAGALAGSMRIPFLAIRGSLSLFLGGCLAVTLGIVPFEFLEWETSTIIQLVTQSAIIVGGFCVISGAIALVANIAQRNFVRR